MQKVHGAPVNTGVEHRRFLDQPVLGTLALSLALFLILCAIIYFARP